MSNYASVLLSCLFIAGCAATGPATDKPGASNPPAAAATSPPILNELKGNPIPGRLVLLPPDPTDGAKSLETDAPAYPDQASRQLVLNECTASPPQGATKALPILALVISTFFDYVVNWGSEEVQKEVQKYTAGYEVSAAGHFYTYAAKKGVPTELSPNIRCIRLVQLEKDGSKADIDFVGEVKISDNKEYFQVRPLSLYVGKVAADGDPVSLSLELQMTGIWYDRNRGYRDQVLDATLFSEKLKLDDIKKGSYTYYFDKDKAAQGLGKQFMDWNHFAKLPLPPVSVSRSGALITEDTDDNPPITSAGSVVMTAKISEVGKMPGWLSALAGFLKSEGSGVSKGLSSAVDTELGIKPSTSGSGGSSQ